MHLPGIILKNRCIYLITFCFGTVDVTVRSLKLSNLERKTNILDYLLERTFPSPIYPCPFTLMSLIIQYVSDIKHLFWYGSYNSTIIFGSSFVTLPQLSFLLPTCICLYPLCNNHYICLSQMVKSSFILGQIFSIHQQSRLQNLILVFMKWVT